VTHSGFQISWVMTGDVSAAAAWDVSGAHPGVAPLGRWRAAAARARDTLPARARRHSFGGLCRAAGAPQTCLLWDGFGSTVGKWLWKSSFSFTFPLLITLPVSSDAWNEGLYFPHSLFPITFTHPYLEFYSVFCSCPPAL